MSKELLGMWRGEEITTESPREKLIEFIKYLSKELEAEKQQREITVSLLR